MEASFLADFNTFLADLTSPERRSILALTEIARDALQNCPGAASSLAGVITNRILQAPVHHKLPVFYLLDSIAKNVGEPYKSYFSSNLADVFCNTWQMGGPSLQPPLEKLLNTWVGVFPQPVLNTVHAQLMQLRAAPALQSNGYGAAHGMYGGGYAAPVVQPQQPFAQPMQQQYQQQQPPPMVQDPRLAGGVQYPPLQQQQLQQQQLQQQQLQQQQLQQQQLQQQQPYGMQQPGYSMRAAAPPMQQLGSAYGVQPAYGGAVAPNYSAPPQLPMQQPLPAYGGAPPAQQQQHQQPAPAPMALPDLLSSLLNAGLLPAATPQAGVAATTEQPTRKSLRTSSTAAKAAPEQPPSVEFTPERLKESNSAAVARLLRITEATKSRFLDRKFLRRQRQTSLKESRLWYVDLDTWMASTTASGGQREQAAQGSAAAGAPPPVQPPEECSTPVDDTQTHCALSGERFEQFWDEQHQEWRYQGARRLDAEEAATYGLQEGAIVLVSALGTPAADVLQASGDGGGGGVLSALQEEEQVAAELAAAAAAGDGNGQTAMTGAKHARHDAAADNGEQEQQQPDGKRVKLEPVAVR